MVVDSSALLAILLGEPDCDAFLDAMASADRLLLSSVNALESAIVVRARKGPEGGRELDLLLHEASVDVIPFVTEQLTLAVDAWERYGKGRHPAGLNMGDCCAYALSRHSGEPLLFKGDDFPLTDLVTVSL